MKMERLVIQLPKPLKAKLDALRTHGYACSGFIRSVLEREFQNTGTQPAGRRGQKGGPR